jgi:hypothetical protein
LDSSQNPFLVPHNFHLPENELETKNSISGVSNLPVTCSSSSLSDPEASSDSDSSSLSGSEFSEDIDNPTADEQDNTALDRNSSSDKIGEVAQQQQQEQELKASSVNERPPVGETAERLPAEQTGVAFGTQPNNTMVRLQFYFLPVLGPVPALGRSGVEWSGSSVSAS